MSRPVFRSLFATLAAGAAGACVALQPSFRPHNGAGGGLAPTTADATGTSRGFGGRDTTLFGRPRDHAARVPGDGGGLEARRVCRNASLPRGWVAVGYEGGSGDCPRFGGADSVATVAVIVHYSNAAPDTRLDICADQPIPTGWVTTPDESPSDPGACPTAVRHGDTVLRIRRVS